jgi:hypothetical protein
MWNKFVQKIQGVLVEGDPNVRPTTIWNWLPMKLWGWKMAAVLRVSDEVARAGYRIGYQPTVGGKALIGAARLNSAIFHDRVFRVRIGREACTFFAQDLQGREIELDLVDRTTIKDGSFQAAPLR